MKQELFNPQSSSVRASRIIYTPSAFARTSLVYLQEVGSFESLSPHVSKRSNLVSFLCFIVLSGRGQLSYEGEVYKLAVGDCVFIDCQKAYSHSTGILVRRIAMKIFGLFNGVTFMPLRFQMYIKNTESVAAVRYSTRRM